MKKKIIILMLCLILVINLVLVLSPFTIHAKMTKNSFNGIGKVLVQGAPISGANGIMFDENDILYIASVFGFEIVLMDPKSGHILERIPARVPDDLTFGPDGSLYYTSTNPAGSVFRIEPDGTVTEQIVAPGTNSITFSDDGRLFVGLDFSGDGLFELDPQLIAPPTPIVVSPPTPFLGFLNGMDFGPDGLLYAPSWLGGRVVSIEVDPPYTISTVCDEDFGIPAAVKFDSQGNLYVADQMKGEVSRIDVDTGHKEVIATDLIGLDNIAFDSEDRLYVSHAQDGSIYEILSSGQTRLVSKGGMIAPGGVAVMPDAHAGESVFVADLWTLREFDGLTGKAESVEPHYLSVPGGITSPFTVSADGENLILSSWLANTVQVWNPATRSIEEEYLGLAFPLNAIGFQGDIAVAQLATGSVIWASDRSTIANGLFVPTGLAAIGDDLYVCDWASGLLWRIVTDGTPTMTLVATDLSYPEGLAVDLDGNLLVVETGVEQLTGINPNPWIETRVGQLTRINPNAFNEKTVLVEGIITVLTGIPWIFTGVAVDSKGEIYVTGDGVNVLYRFKPLN